MCSGRVASGVLALACESCEELVLPLALPLLPTTRRVTHVIAHRAHS